MVFPKKFWVLPLLYGCQTTVPSENLLDKRADYDDRYYTERTAQDAQQFLLRSQKSKVRYTDIRIYPHELPSGELFLGGWVRFAAVRGQLPRKVESLQVPNSQQENQPSGNRK